jgi:tellurite resistance protein
MSGLLSDFTHLYHESQKKRLNRPFLNAAMAACAMVSISEGEVEFCDRIRLDQILTPLDRLKIFAKRYQVLQCSIKVMGAFSIWI